MLLISWQDRKTLETKSVRFDIISTESWESLLKITEHPVEQGADVADNARPAPRRVSLHGYVSNKPIWSNPGVEQFMEYSTESLAIPTPPIPRNFAGAVANVVAAAQGLKPVRAIALRPTGDFPDRARIMYETLFAAQKVASIFRIVSKVGEIDSLMLERLGVPKTPEDGDGLSFEVDFQQVRLVKSETVSAPSPAEARGQPQVSKGSKSPQEKNDAKKQEQAKSILATSFDAGAGMVGSISKKLSGVD